MAYQPHHPAAHAYPSPGQQAGVAAYVGPALGFIGALMVIFGSLMPWVTVQSVLGTVTGNGTDGDGVITLAVGVVLAGGAIATAFTSRLWLWIAQVVAAVAAAGLSLFEMWNVTTGVENVGGALARASVGSGIYVLLIGSLLAAAAAVLHIGFRRAQ